MYNLSTQELVLSIEKSPLLEKHGIVYQEYTNFFDNLLISKIKNEIDNLKLVKLEQQETIARQRADYNETLCKELKIIFLNQKITQALENNFNTSSSVLYISSSFPDNATHLKGPFPSQKRGLIYSGTKPGMLNALFIPAFLA